MYKEYKQQQHWNDHYKKKQHAVLNYDGWLDSYMQRFPKDGRVLDLGCGSGSDTDVLLNQGFSVCSADFSEEALQIMKELIPSSVPMKMDMTEKFPFQDDAFDVVVADLSLHYFEWSLTRQIVEEIGRVLKASGMLLARFNSDKDYGFGAGNGEIIEPGLRLVNGRTKRFFSAKNINDLFGEGWEVFCKQENITDRYSKKKAYWEFAAYNRKDLMKN